MAADTTTYRGESPRREGLVASTPSPSTPCFVCGEPGVRRGDCPRAYCPACTAEATEATRRGYFILREQSTPLVVLR